MMCGHIIKPEIFYICASHSMCLATGLHQGLVREVEEFEGLKPIVQALEEHFHADKT